MKLSSKNLPEERGVDAFISFLKRKKNGTMHISEQGFAHLLLWEHGTVGRRQKQLWKELAWHLEDLKRLCQYSFGPRGILKGSGRWHILLESKAYRNVCLRGALWVLQEIAKFYTSDFGWRTEIWPRQPIAVIVCCSVWWSYLNLS